MINTRSKTFCVVPWVQLATNATGKYRVCCNSLPGKNIIQDDDGNSKEVLKDSPQDVWNSKTYVDLRKQFLNGEKPEMCERCFREEDAGIKSARQKNNDNWSSSQEEQSVIKLDVKYIDLRLGNLCNLKCRMCNPYASSKWVYEWNDVSETAKLVPDFQLTEEEGKRLANINWPKDNKTWENLFPILESVEEIYLTGGEPFLSIEQKVLLKKIIEKGFAKKIILKYNTNLTILPDELLEIWPYFKKVKLNVSLDAYGALNDYIRYPAKWDVIEKNLKTILEKEYLDVGIHITVQMYNILILDEIFSRFIEQYSCVPYLNILNHPSCLNIRVLPKDLKEKVLNKLERIQHYEEIAKVIKYLDKESWSEENYLEFKTYTNKLDSLRNENFSDIIKEFNF